MNVKKTYTVDEARAKLEYYCAYQDRCHKEVRAKLKDMGMIPAATEQIITHLIQHNFLNEERFARSFARGKFNIKNWGKLRIIRELKFREISRFNIDAALKEIDEEVYLEKLHSLAEWRLGQIDERNPFKRKKKLADYLLYRGWEPHLVYELVQDLT
ncbi:regulatory protein RecX [Robertkochia aurantiaca]|uniref:regulatory protein RecX n=1 Tax=Robertkochia aurantiaca TaxID=2873700 RepID=UPI001CCA649B